MQTARLFATDLAPRFSRRVRVGVRHPLGVLTLAAGIAGICGLVIHPRVFALAAGLTLVGALGVWWPWLTLRGVRGQVGFERDRVNEGESAVATVAVANAFPWPAWGLAVCGGYGSSADARLDSVAGRHRVISRWAFSPPLRGEYPLTTPRITTAFPFGLWTSSRSVVVEGRLIVWPRTFPVGTVSTTDGETAVEGAARGRIGSTGDVVGVRPYRRGDSPRRVHWAQSAKHDRLVVCELEAPTRPVVLLVLDADPAVHTAGPDGTREWAIRVVASFAKGWLTAGVPVGAVWGETFFPPAAGGGQLLRLLDGLARVPDTTPPLADVLATPLVRGAGGAIRVVVTTDVGVRAQRSGDGLRWVALEQAGFPGTGSQLGVRCDKKPEGRLAAKSWLTISDPDAVPDRLRHGWAEARHGS